MISALKGDSRTQGIPTRQHIMSCSSKVSYMPSGYRYFDTGTWKCCCICLSWSQYKSRPAS